MMGRYEKLIGRIQQGECIMIDGATGTEIERRGVPQLENAWNGGGALSHPEVLLAVHEDYLRAGAEIIISSNFATHYYALRDAGVEIRFEEYNRRGVELALEARVRAQKPEALVAAGISYWSWSGDHPDLADLRSAAVRQVSILADAGAELIMLEMMIDIDKMLVLLESAQTTGLPVWVGFTCELNEQGEISLRNGETLSAALSALDGRGVDLVNIMHTDVDLVPACLDVTNERWPGAVGVYAHSGIYKEHHWVFSSTIAPDDYAVAARGWIDRGVNVVGGCCGIEPRHMKRLALEIRNF